MRWHNLWKGKSAKDVKRSLDYEMTSRHVEDNVSGLREDVDFLLAQVHEEENN